MEAPFLNIHQALLTHWFSLVNNIFKIIYLLKLISFSFFVGNHGITV
jgi:hypothetical protein